MSYWDAYFLPVPIRKYWIHRFNERTKEGKEDSTKPLTDAEKKKIQRDILNNPAANIFSSQRNQK